MRNSVNTSFGVDLPATATFDHPTVTALAAFIASKAAPVIQVKSICCPSFAFRPQPHCHLSKQLPKMLTDIKVGLLSYVVSQRLPLGSLAAPVGSPGLAHLGPSTTDVVGVSSTLATSHDTRAGMQCSCRTPCSQGLPSSVSFNQTVHTHGCPSRERSTQLPTGFFCIVHVG